MSTNVYAWRRRIGRFARTREWASLWDDALWIQEDVDAATEPFRLPAGDYTIRSTLHLRPVMMSMNLTGARFRVPGWGRPFQVNHHPPEDQ